MKKKLVKNTPSIATNELRTDFPLCEKDEQAIAIERLRKLQVTATLRWRALHEERK